MPIAVLTLPGVMSVGAGDCNDHRVDAAQARPRLIPVAALRFRLDRREQQIASNQRQRHQLHRHDP
jgi:hypothetical protein